jgi:uncharacterized protein (DUF1697 family)
MSKHVVLLRGINVGGNKRVDMAGLRTLMEELGYADVKTLLNSGNVVFAADGSKPDASTIAKAIKARYGFDVAVVLRSAADLKKVVAANPFEQVATDGSRYFVSFLDQALPAGALSGIDPAAYEPELLHAAKRELYTWLPAGIIDSLLMKQLTDKKLGVTATARNWNTVTKLAVLARDD